MPRTALLFLLLAGWWLAPSPLQATDKTIDPAFLGALKARCIGPALMSGRIGDVAVSPANRSDWYVAACSGGVFKTSNGGTTFDPIFDGQGSYSIGCVAIDPGNPAVVWVGTGENNSQRSVSFGDGVYRSADGGRSWKNVGLAASEHIGRIAIDPRDGNVVYVAAQGPLWRSGGDRGLYKTRDGGATWERVLHVSDDTGINEVHFDPRNPDVLFASAYQRRRHVWTLINGGPESAIYKSTDAGSSWRKVSGLPSEDKGRIGLAVSPVDPDRVYAIVEAANDAGGFFRSLDRGETWKRMSSTMTSSPQYYNEIVCDPEDPDKVYLMDTFLQVTVDGGRSFRRAGQSDKHVDEHALWIDPLDSSHLVSGCDGGLYESWDGCDTWIFKANLPLTQFYKICLDDAEPFYNIYGGTQDNNTQGGPSRTTDRAGIINADWFITVGGDGFEPQVEPGNPDIVYSQWQYGGLARHDRRSGEVVDIKPREKPGEAPYVWNWDSPLLVSPHSPTRIYYGGDRLFRSEDRGNSWTMVSGDLTRGIDRNELQVMGKVQKADAVAKDMSTSIYGNTVAISESPLEEGLLYVGTDDGLVHVTPDGGKTWSVIDVFPGVPHMSYVGYLLASRHEKDRVYAAFDNHKNGDFKPYLLVSGDRGRTWRSISGDLSDRDICYAIAEDHLEPGLLFAGTEFGASFTVDGGKKWLRVPGLPTIAVRDIEIQRRENDLVLGTFGRSFYVLDDYSPLRTLAEVTAEKKDGHIFPVKKALLYVERSRLGGRGGRGSQGGAYYNADNPPFGAVFTYLLSDKLSTRLEKRMEREKKDDAPYPTVDEMRAEDEEKEPRVFLTVRKGTGGEVVRHVEGSRQKGLHRVAWDLRYPGVTPVQVSGRSSDGPLVVPGTYSVTLSKEVDGAVSEIAGPVPFEVEALDQTTLPAQDPAEVLAFHKRAGELLRAVTGAQSALGETQERLSHLRVAITETPAAKMELLATAQEIQKKIHGLGTRLSGDRTVARRQEPTPPSIADRIRSVWFDAISVTSAPTQTQQDQARYAAEEFSVVLKELRDVIEKDLTLLEKALEAAGAPWTPGRVPVWGDN